MKGDGLRYDAGKPRVDLLCPGALLATAAVMERGARKYAEFNWAQGMKWSKVIGPLFRHLLKFMAGHDYDRDDNCEGCQKGDCVDHTGLPHVDLIACNAMFLQYFFRAHRDLDDRYPGWKESNE